jgi:hypothetical protein
MKKVIKHNSFDLDIQLAKSWMVKHALLSLCDNSLFNVVSFVCNFNPDQNC